ncbi:metal-dependent transcriptional regulator [Glutamicibacter sp. MNS18]|uniref:metal-dependent transcriptional regulator n=1 Tax=Glutamicibacter sp. MNS18 TaxID=2989817 RepID=UPI0022367309|nr:metal-dependent transcriptional regulator [Glutamicibacter sp. MNS18]MCW4466489.1 metal-dependent transcriptional regulator [Glutamicibacter sp. MNS18]
MSDLIDTTEMYLRTILELQEEEIVALRARIAERLGHSGPTVSQTVARMERDGLVVVSTDRHLALTEKGHELATGVMRKHRLAERLLSDMIGLDWEYVHEEACRWEHVMSERVEQRLYELLGKPTVSPYGNPIPGLEVLGGPTVAEISYDVENLDNALEAGNSGPMAIERLAEPIQTDPILLGQLNEGGIKPGAVVTLERADDYMVVRVEGIEGALELPVEVSSHIFVRSGRR